MASLVRLFKSEKNDRGKGKDSKVNKLLKIITKSEMLKKKENKHNKERGGRVYKVKHELLVPVKCN